MAETATATGGQAPRDVIDADEVVAWSAVVRVAARARDGDAAARADARALIAARLEGPTGGGN